MTLPIPTVTINVLDNTAGSSVTLPSSSVQLVMGCVVGGTTLVPAAFATPNGVKTFFTGGPAVEYGGLLTQAGAVGIFIGLPIATKGSAGTVQHAGTGASVVTVTLDATNGAWDDYYVEAKIVTSGTVGTAGWQVQISLDAGRNFGPILSPGTGVSTIAIPNTGVTLNFTSASVVAADTYTFYTVAPAWNDAGVQSAIAAFSASQFALQGVGSCHLVGISGETDAANIATYMATLTTQFIYDRILLSARDASPYSTTWGGSSETETAWINSLSAAFAPLGNANTERLVVGAAYYNMPSPFPNSTAGTPAYRRSCTWAEAVRRVLIGPQRRAGAVADGSLSNITVNPNSDPFDNFIYHDERITPGLNAARFMTCMTWPRQQGFFVCQENLMSPTGSQFTELVIGNVIDEACDIAYAKGVTFVSDDLRQTPQGTLYQTDANNIQNIINSALNVGMVNTSPQMVSSASAVVSTSFPVAIGILITLSVLPLGYVNAIIVNVVITPT